MNKRIGAALLIPAASWILLFTIIGGIGALWQAYEAHHANNIVKTEVIK